MSEPLPIVAVPLAGTPSDWLEHTAWADHALNILGQNEVGNMQDLSVGDRRALLIRSRSIPDWRRPPERTAVDVADADWEATFYQRAELELRVGLFRRFDHGLLFRISALEPEGAAPRRGARIPNLGFRIRPDLPHRIRLLAYTDAGGDLLTNTAHPGEFPDDPETPWLVGGSSGSGLAARGFESRAEYFISSRQPINSLTLFASYPEFDIPASGVDVTIVG